MNGCRCNFNAEHKRCIFDCQNLGLSEIPRLIPNETEWLILRGNHITSGCADLGYLGNGCHLDLKDNLISELCVNMIEHFYYVDISNNKIEMLPESITHVTNMSLMLGGNPYRCECDIFWMSEWLVDENDIVKDYQNVKCKSGKNIGQQIKTLTKDKMDCIQPPIVAIVVSSLIVTTIVVLVFLFFTHYESIKFFFFVKYNIRVNEDHVEDVDAMEFDALIAYRFGTRRNFGGWRHCKFIFI